MEAARVHGEQSDVELVRGRRDWSGRGFGSWDSKALCGDFIPGNGATWRSGIGGFCQNNWLFVHAELVAVLDEHFKCFSSVLMHITCCRFP